MSTWSMQDAKARFSELLDEALKKGPQVVTRRGVETAVVVPIDEWRRLQENAGPGLKAWLLAPEPRFDIVLPKRGRWKMRKPIDSNESIPVRYRCGFRVEPTAVAYQMMNPFTSK